MFYGVEIIALIGFALAAYAIVANDVIQTLGTFLSSNSKRPWLLLWAFASVIIIAVMAYGWFFNASDISFDRLNRIPYPGADTGAPDRPAWLAAIDPPGGVEWYHVAPPLVLLLLTRFGIPVSTTFLVLTIFALTGGAATEGVMEDMLIKSGVGYLVAFAAGGVIWLIVSKFWEAWISRTKDQPINPIWVVLQFASTGFLWWQWLVQDLANIFVFLPRETTVVDGATQVTFGWELVAGATALMVFLHLVIFATKGGEIQKIVLTKTNTTDIRAATLVDFVYALVLVYFKELNDVPMSTTWVFLGLLAGRELAISLLAPGRTLGATAFDLVGDAMRALIGLLISVFLAITIPQLAGAPSAIDLGVYGTAGLVAAAFVLGGILWALRRQAEAANRLPG